MPNITISLDDETHRIAKIHAATTGTSLSQLFREHVRKIAGQQLEQSPAAGTLKRYAAFEVSGRDAMETLELACLEDLMVQTVQAGFHLPRPDDRSARVMAQKFLRS